MSYPKRPESRNWHPFLAYLAWFCWTDFLVYGLVAPSSELTAASAWVEMRLQGLEYQNSIPSLENVFPIRLLLGQIFNSHLWWPGYFHLWHLNPAALKALCGTVVLLMPLIVHGHPTVSITSITLGHHAFKGGASHPWSEAQQQLWEATWAWNMFSSPCSYHTRVVSNHSGRFLWSQSFGNLDKREEMGSYCLEL